MPANDTCKEREEDGKSRPDQREVLVNSQEPEADRRDAKLHDHEESAPPVDQTSHEGVELETTMSQVGQGQIGIQRLEQKDREEDQPQGSPKAVNIVRRRVRGASTAPAPPPEEDVSRNERGRAMPTFRSSSRIVCRHYFTSIVDVLEADKDDCVGK